MEIKDREIEINLQLLRCK